MSAVIEQPPTRISIRVDNAAVIDGVECWLKPTEAEILRVLLSCWPGYATHGFIQDRLWRREALLPEDPLNNVKVHVCGMRRRLKHSPARILNVRGRGYQLAFIEELSE